MSFSKGRWQWKISIKKEDLPGHIQHVWPDGSRREELQVTPGQEVRIDHYDAQSMNVAWNLSENPNSWDSVAAILRGDKPGKPQVGGRHSPMRVTTKPRAP